MATTAEDVMHKYHETLRQMQLKMTRLEKEQGQHLKEVKQQARRDTTEEYDRDRSVHLSAPLLHHSNAAPARTSTEVSPETSFQPIIAITTKAQLLPHFPL